jgi:hypothetical protein
MKSIFLALTLTAVAVLTPDAVANAQEDKVARGTIAELGGTSLTLTVIGESMTFGVDRHTRVAAPGGSTKMRQASMNGRPGPHIDDVLKVGQAVAVTYKDVPNPRASLVRAISGDRAGGSVKTASAMRSNGTVTAVGADSITIRGASGGGAKFTQTFTIAADTMVVGKGAGTASAANGGRAPVTQLISAGDRVSVAYLKVGNGLLASDVRVTLKGSN